MKRIILTILVIVPLFVSAQTGLIRYKDGVFGFQTGLIESIDPLTVGLVAYYPFEGNANDESGNGNDGTVNGATLTTDRFGDANSAYDFDGVSNVIDLPTIAMGGNTGSFGGWGQCNNTAVYNTLIGRYYQQHSIQYFNNFFRINYNNSTLNYTGFTSDNDWHHLLLTYDGNLPSNNLKFYYDGVHVASVDLTGDNINENRIWQIGSHGNSDRFWNGSIDDIRIYNRALSEDEVESIYELEK